MQALPEESQQWGPVTCEAHVPYTGDRVLGCRQHGEVKLREMDKCEPTQLFAGIQSTEEQINMSHATSSLNTKVCLASQTGSPPLPDTETALFHSALILGP